MVQEPKLQARVIPEDETGVHVCPKKICDLRLIYISGKYLQISIYHAIGAEIDP